MGNRIQLTGKGLGLAQAALVMSGEPLHVSLSAAASRAVAASSRRLKAALRSPEPIYGVNTGFGSLCDQRIPRAGIRELQLNLLRSHACGSGEALPDDVVRLAMVLRAQSLSRGASGVRPVVVARLLACVNAGVTPVVPGQGSVGASGDLAPLASLALVLVGEGRARLRGREMDGASALKKAGVSPLVLDAKEGLALLNGTQISTALAAAACLRARSLSVTADAVGALSVEAYRGSGAPFDRRIAALRGHPGTTLAAANLRACLDGSEVMASHAGCGRVQDPYCLRCMPQVHGAAKDLLDQACRAVEREMNAVTDNPLLAGRDVISGGNFHGMPVALAADQLALALATWANISERRTALLTDGKRSGMPEHLAPPGGLNSGYMLLQTHAAALAAEVRHAAAPMSVHSIPTGADQEDHVPMATAAAARLEKTLGDVEGVVALEALCAAQALDLVPPKIGRRRAVPGAGAEAVRKAVRRRARALMADRDLTQDVAALRAAVTAGELATAADAACGPLSP